MTYLIRYYNVVRFLTLGRLTNMSYLLKGLIFLLLFMPLCLDGQCLLDSIMINSLLIDPTGDNDSYDTNSDGTVNSDDEYIELCNVSNSQTVDLSGWRVNDDDPPPFPDFLFPNNSIIEPGECIVLVNDYCGNNGADSGMPCDTPDGVVDMNFSETGLLGNTGDVITLVNADGSESCSVTYGDVLCEDVDPLDSPFFDVNQCDYWGQDEDGCPLLISGISCGYEPSVLPVQFVSFTARTVENKNVFLEWETVTESLNDKFVIEWRSEYSSEFKVLGEVPSQNNQQEIAYYNFWHKFPDTGQNYYRLRQIDLDGSFIFSPVRQAFIYFNEDLILYPSLANDRIYINGYANEYLVNIFDLQGQLILKKLRKRNNELIDLQSLEKGYYMARIFDGEKIVNKKFIKI